MCGIISGTEFDSADKIFSVMLYPYPYSGQAFLPFNVPGEGFREPPAYDLRNHSS